MALGVSLDLFPPLLFPCIVCWDYWTHHDHDCDPLLLSRTVLYCGAFHRIHCILLLCSSATGAPQVDRKEVLLAGSGSLVGKRDESLDLSSKDIKDHLS